MNHQSELRHGYDMIYLVSCALHDRVAEKQYMEAMDLSGVYQMAKHHTLTSITYFALERYLQTPEGKQLSIDSALLAQWKDAKNKAVRKNILFDVERENILTFMEEQGIWYLPLKGVLLKEFYPNFAMRQMADNDILFDPSYREVLHDYMLRNGYTAEEYNRGHHDTYRKAPLYNFEMHVSLFAELHGTKWYTYYHSVKDRLRKEEGTGFGYHFSDEDFYIYFLAHAYKHFAEGGNGIRSLVDGYVYIQQKQQLLNWEYIAGELEKLGMTAFERESRALAEKLFATDCPDLNHASVDLSQTEQELLAYYLSSGTYGTTENRFENMFRQEGGGDPPANKKSKFRYYWRRVFPGRAYYKSCAPIVDQYPILIPFYCIGRLIKALFVSGDRIRKEARSVWNYKK